jgi:type II secretory pathway component GspD/PulD (secretin)
MLGDNTPGGDPGIVLGASNLKLAYDQANRAYEIDGRGRIGGQSRTWSDLRTETEGAGSSVEDGAASSSSSEGYTRSVMEGAGQSDYQTYFNGKNIWGIDVDDEGKVTMTVPDKDSLTYSREILRSAVLSANQLNVVLNALKTTEGISIISNPKIIVASGSTNAYFKVGDREPMVRQETILGTTENQRDRTIAQLDTSISTDFIKGGYLETGISLQVVPVVKTENMIEAIILPRLVRRLLPDKEVAGNSWPRISVKEITTKFTLQSGQTVAIGGLTDTSDTKNVSKIPLLGDIPLIGKYLFSHTKDMKKQVETVVLVTLSLAEPERLAAGIGIPDNATLVHKKLIQAKSERRRFEQDLEKLKAASEAEGSEAQP